MRLLLDECLPRPLKRELSGHIVDTVPEMGWAAVKNGALLRLAADSFDVFITTDQNLQYQQNLRGASIAIIVLKAVNNQLVSLLPLVPALLVALDTIQAGDVVIITL